MKHVVIIADPFELQNAGIYRYTTGMINALADYCPDIKVTAVVSSKKFPNSKVESLFVPRFFSFLKNDPVRKIIRIPRMINRLKPDFVIEPAHFGPLRISEGIKRITVIHDLVPVIKPQYSQFVSSMLQRMFLPGILKNTHAIIANSEFTKGTIITRYGFCINKTHVVYPGTETNYKAGEWNNKLISGISPGNYFLHVGTIEPRKNIYNLLDAFSDVKLKTGNNSLKLVLAGNIGWIGKRFTQKLKSHPYHDSIIITGFIPEESLQMLYKYAIALVFPSHYEGFGFPIIEAFSNTCKVVCSDIPVFREIAGDNAVYFDPDDINDISDKMINISGSISNSFVNENTNNITQKFTWKNYARSLSLILESL